MIRRVAEFGGSISSGLSVRRRDPENHEYNCGKRQSETSHSAMFAQSVRGNQPGKLTFDDVHELEKMLKRLKLERKQKGRVNRNDR